MYNHLKRFQLKPGEITGLFSLSQTSMFERRTWVQVRIVVVVVVPVGTGSLPECTVGLLPVLAAGGVSGHLGMRGQVEDGGEQALRAAVPEV